MNSCFYTTGGFVWAVVDHGLGCEFKSGRIFWAGTPYYRALTRWPKIAGISVFSDEIHKAGSGW